jgi:hypothetical protein
MYTSRHFMVAKDHTPLEAVPDGYTPFYGNKVGDFITSGLLQIDEIRCRAIL